jgi:hypothetical protein
MPQAHGFCAMSLRRAGFIGTLVAVLAGQLTTTMNITQFALLALR